MIFAFSLLYFNITFDISEHQLGFLNLLLINILFIIPNLFISISLYLGKKGRLLILSFLVYWLLQTVAVEISGFAFTLANGPFIAIGLKAVNGNLAWNFITVPWILDFTFKYDFLSFRTVIGINLVALFISVYLIYFYNKYTSLLIK